MIIFEKIRFKNFLSYGNSFTEIYFLKSKTTLLLGENGAGKSSLCEAVSFVLFGKSYRKANKPSLVNNKNNKDCLVEITFKVNQDSYLVRRGLKPAIFEIYKNDVLINQDAASRDYQKYLEESILHLNYSTFCNTILVGKSTYVSFFKLSAYERRKFVEDLLSLNIFSIMNDINKTNLSKLKQEYENIKTSIKVIKVKLDSTVQYIKKIQEEDEQKKTELVDFYSIKLNNIENNKSEIENLLKLTDDQLSEISFNSEDYENLNKRIDEFKNVIAKAEMRLNQIESERLKISEQSSCIHCGQEISKDLKQTKLISIGEQQEKINKIYSDAKIKHESNIRKKDILSNDLLKITNLENQKVKYLNELRRLDAEFNNIKSELENLKSKVSTSVISEKETAKQLLIDYENSLEEKDRLLSNIENLDFINEVLKDTGIKASIVKQYLPIIINTVNSYLMKFGFNVRLEFDEMFNERILVNGITELNYYNYSEGEKLRIDLAMILTWKYLTKLQKNADSNLFILDEILTASMDEEGIEMFLNILNEIEYSNLFIIAHAFDKFTSFFQSELTFIKDTGFSEIRYK